MTAYIVVLGTIAAIGWTIALLDWLGRRHEQKTQQRTPH
jgi:hypothetical protein